MSAPPPVRWVREHPLHADALLAGALCVIGVVAHFVDQEGRRDPTAYGVVLCVLATVPLVWRRRSPIPVLVVVLAAQLSLEIMDFSGPGWFPVVIGCYSLTAHGPRRLRVRAAIVFWVAVALFAIVGLLVGQAPWRAVPGVISLALAMAVGDNVRRRRESWRDEAERLLVAERERELLAHRQMQDERTRIARELHDVVAHSVSVMVIQAAAARRQLAANPEQATEALLTIEQMGRQAMNEMRRVLGVLRNGERPAGAPADLEPQPTLASLADLVAAASDLPITLHVDEDLHAVPPAVELSVYRIVQEALTNVRRHAGIVHRVSVSVAEHATSLVVEVADDGRSASADHSADAGGGFGMIGMNERVAMFSGQLVAGPQNGGGWRVRATFPLVAS